MKFENEITVLVNCSYEELTELMVSQGFKVTVDTYFNDLYMVENNFDILNDRYEDILIKL